jgi:hypothetical protein
MLTKYKFNMVEIALAMVVIALGISGILGLFAVGVNAKKAAISENNIADVAEYMLGTYRTVILNHIYENPGSSGVLKGIGLSSKPSDDDVDDSKWDIDDSSLKRFKVASTETHIYYKTGTIPQVFCYMPSRTTADGVKIPDCQIIGRIWAENPQVEYRDWAKDTVSNASFDFYTKDYAMKVLLELSWPVEKKYEDREKRVFVMYITNPTKEL